LAGPLCLVTHYVTCFSESPLPSPPLPIDGWLVADLACCDNAGVIKGASIRKRRGLIPGYDLPLVRLVRIRIPVAVAGAKVSVETLCPPERHGYHLQDICVHPRRVGRPHRYVYGSCSVSPRPCNSFDGVCRIDATDGSVLTWHDSPNVIPAAPTTFLPRPGADPADETDGVLFVDCLGADGHAHFVVLDGRSFAEVARVTLPHRHCRGLGSTWIWGSIGI